MVKFDLVVGNPPYNNDMYLDFVIKGHELSKGYSLWITPITFVTPSIGKSAEVKKSKKDFLLNIKPKIRSLVYYPDEVDIFLIKKPGGVMIYLCDNTIDSSVKIVNKCSRVKNSLFDSTMIRSLGNNLFLNSGVSIISKLGNFNSFDFDAFEKNNRFRVSSSDMTSYCNSVAKNMVYFLLWVTLP